MRNIVSCINILGHNPGHTFRPSLASSAGILPTPITNQSTPRRHLYAQPAQHYQHNPTHSTWHTGFSHQTSTLKTPTTTYDKNSILKYINHKHNNRYKNNLQLHKKAHNRLIHCYPKDSNSFHHPTPCTTIQFTNPFLTTDATCILNTSSGKTPP